MEQYNGTLWWGAECTAAEAVSVCWCVCGRVLQGNIMWEMQVVQVVRCVPCPFPRMPLQACPKECNMGSNKDSTISQSDVQGNTKMLTRLFVKVPQPQLG